MVEVAVEEVGGDALRFVSAHVRLQAIFTVDGARQAALVKHRATRRQKK